MTGGGVGVPTEGVVGGALTRDAPTEFTGRRRLETVWVFPI